MAISLNPAETPAGQFSPLLALIRNALAELGESSPDVMLDTELLRMVGYANRVVNDVNTHPLFLDILTNAWDATTGSITAGTNLLTLNGASTSANPLQAGYPVLVAGAGDSGGDLYTKTITVSGPTVRLADDAGTTVSGTPVRCPYDKHIARYRSATEIRAVDDIVLIEGMKFYYSVDDTINAQAVTAQVKQARYVEELNKWLVGMLNYNAGMYHDFADDDGRDY